MIRWMRVLFPKICPMCGEAVRETEILCAACAQDLPQRPKKALIGEVNGRPVYCRALYRYHSAVRRALLQMKFAGQCSRAEGFGQLLGALVAGETYDLVTYVPMEAYRERIRGYNQARLLAEYCGAVCSIPVKPVLYKTRHTAVQHEQESTGARARNVEGAYAAHPLNGASVLLCDDIATSCTTLRSCVHALKQAGASEVQCICVALSGRAL
ncbi:MAG: ComF family protein [Clostridia bacterium]|nr:ComF family protein [Clostridia bacterium]